MSVLKILVESICDGIRDMINCQLLPRMVRHGFDVAGLSFEWDDPVDYTPEQQVAYERMVLENYEVPGSYFEDKYGIPAGERKMLPGMPSEDGSLASGGGRPFFD